MKLLLAVLTATSLSVHATPAGAQTLSSDEQRMVEYVDAHIADAESLLERIVNLNSGTMNHDGVREVGVLLGDELGRLGFAVRWIAMPDSVDRAGHLFATREGDRGKRLLLIGHIDTVFEPHDAFQTFEREGAMARGPGAVDMKGGVVTIVFALKALEAAGVLDGAAITVALIGDEEFAGLPLEISRGDLIAAARESDVALGFEPGQPGRAVNARRGSSAWTLETSGQQGHSSRIFGERYGSGAIFEMARILHRFHEEVRGPEHLTFNPGVVVGGTDVTYDGTANRGDAFGKTNVIAQRVVVDGGLRFITEDQKEEARQKMRAIVDDHLPGTGAEIRFQDKYPAMPPTDGNRALLARLDAVSQALSQGPVEAFDPSQRGAADISFVAPYVDGLDGLGPFGSGIHTPDERIDLESMPIVAKRAAILLHRLAQE